VKVSIDLDVALVRTLALAIARELETSRPASPAPSLGSGRLLTRRQARDELGIEVRALMRAERSGELAAYRFGKAVAYRVGDLEAFVARHRVAPPVPPAEPSETAVNGDVFDLALARAARRKGRANA
jgi:hypothetical protein